MLVKHKRSVFFWVLLPLSVFITVLFFNQETPKVSESEEVSELEEVIEFNKRPVFKVGHSSDIINILFVGTTFALEEKISDQGNKIYTYQINKKLKRISQKYRVYDKRKFRQTPVETLLRNRQAMYIITPEVVILNPPIPNYERSNYSPWNKKMLEKFVKYNIETNTVLILQNILPPDHSLTILLSAIAAKYSISLIDYYSMLPFLKERNENQLSTRGAEFSAKEHRMLAQRLLMFLEERIFPVKPRPDRRSQWAGS